MTAPHHPPMAFKPRATSAEGFLRVCYDVPHHVHTSMVYPSVSPNGSTIIIYGHEQGVSVLWRGGRPFKHDSKALFEEPLTNTKGENQDNIMILDSGDKQPNAVARVGQNQGDMEFETEQQELDPSAPFDSVIQSLDLPLATQVLHFGLPRLPAEVHTRLCSLPPLFKEKIVLTLACSDCTVRVLTMPLIPPSPQRKALFISKIKMSTLSQGKSVLGHQVMALGSRHPSIPKGVSLSFTRVLGGDERWTNERDENQCEHSVMRERSISRVQNSGAWNLMIASHSADLSGLIHIHRIPLIAEGTAVSSGLHAAWHTEHLSSPAISVQFSSALFPDPEHCHLLVAETKGSIRLFTCVPKSLSTRGFWFGSFSSGYCTSTDAIPRRKRLLDAQWLLGGKAIIVLLEDGEWGVWDLGCAGLVDEQQDTTSKVPLSFAVNGRIGSFSEPKMSRAGCIGSSSKSKLAPMTPGTRQSRQISLFALAPVNADDSVTGGLGVAPAPLRIRTRADDDTVLIWYGDNATAMPSFLAQWRNKARGSTNLLGGARTAASYTFSGPQLGGEKCKRIVLMPQLRQSKSPDEPDIRNDLLITGEHRLLAVAATPDTPQSQVCMETTISVDQTLLERGELDVNGMERILNNMSSTRHAPRSALA